MFSFPYMHNIHTACSNEVWVLIKNLHLPVGLKSIHLQPIY